MTATRFGLVAAVCAAAALLELAGLDQALRYAAPVIALAVPLLCGRYPGSTILIARLAAGRDRARCVALAPFAVRRSCHLQLLARGGDLASGSLAGRGPPPPPGSRRRNTTSSRRQRTMRIATTTIAAAAASLALAAPAAAHMGLVQSEAPADDYVKLDFQVPHGCEGDGPEGGDPTRVVRVQIPESVPTVTPQVKPGWTLRTEEGPKDEVELFGETVTEGISEVIWTAESDDQAVPDEYLDVFGLSTRMPDAEGETVYFPSIQECVGGTDARWIQVPSEGESADDLDAGAPSVELVAGEGGHGGSEPHGDEASADEGETTAVQAASTTGGGDDGPSTGLVIAALVLGALGLAAGATALVTSRRGTA